MTPSMVGFKKMYHLPSKGSFLGYNDFLSNGPATDLFIYSSSAQMDATALERKHRIIFVQLC